MAPDTQSLGQQLRDAQPAFEELECVANTRLGIADGDTHGHLYVKLTPSTHTTVGLKATERAHDMDLLQVVRHADGLLVDFIPESQYDLM